MDEDLEATASSEGRMLTEPGESMHSGGVQHQPVGPEPTALLPIGSEIPMQTKVTVSALLLALVACSPPEPARVVPPTEASPPKALVPNEGAAHSDGGVPAPAPTTAAVASPSQAQTTPAPGGYCVREVMPKTAGAIRTLTVDKENLYFTTDFPKQIVKVSKKGGAATVIEAYGGGPFVADDEKFHFVGVRDEDKCTYVVHVPKHDPAARTSTKLCGKVDGLFVYQGTPTLPSQELFATGERTKVGTGILGLAGEAHLIASSASPSEAITASYTKVYWGVRRDGPANDDVMSAVYHVPFGAITPPAKGDVKPGTTKILASKVGLVRGLAVDEDKVYVAADYSLVAIPVNGGTPQKLAVDPAAKRIWGVAVDATNIYWHSLGGERPEPNDSRLGVIPKASPDKGFVLAVGTGDSFSPTSFAVDQNGDVYWANQGTIRVFTKTCGK